MKVVIIEDEELAAEHLKVMVTEIDANIEVVAMLESVENSVDWFCTHPTPDLALMDIELADGQSFEIFNQIQLKCPVIFTTAYDEFAIQAFKVNSIDYLLKPIEEEMLRQSLRKFQHLRKTFGALENTLNLDELKAMLTSHKHVRPNYRDRFLLKQGTKLLPLRVDDIAYFESKEGLTFVKTHDKRSYLIEYPLEELETMVNPKAFFRATRQYLVARPSIDKIQVHLNGRLKITLKPLTEDALIISRYKAPEFRAWMGE